MALEMYALALKASLNAVEPLRESLLTHPTRFSTGDAAISLRPVPLDQGKERYGQTNG